MMKNRSPWTTHLFHFINAFCLIILPIFGIIGTIDQIVKHKPTTQVNSGTISLNNSSQRVFAILVDSLPYSLAVDPQLMPQTTKLLSEASYGRVTSVAEAVTSPAIWSAFTGNVDNRVLDVLRNFGVGDVESSSLFSQLQGLKKTVVVYSDRNSFKPFMSSITKLVRNDIWENENDAKDYQNQQVQDALDAFQSGFGDVMIYHVTYLDSFAHKFHSSETQYRDTVRSIDELIAAAARQIAPDQTLIVFGDHGHTPEGRHLPGLDVPTIFIARGPAFEKELLPNFHISHVRSLFSRASGIGPSGSPAGDFDGQTFDPSFAYGLTALCLLVLLSTLFRLWMAFDQKKSDAQTSRPGTICFAISWSSGLVLCCFGLYPWNLFAALAMSVAGVMLLPESGATTLRRLVPIMLAFGFIMGLGYFFGTEVDRLETLDSAVTRTSDEMLVLTTFALPAFFVHLYLTNRNRYSWFAAAWFIPAVLATLALWTMDLPMKDSLGVITVLALGSCLGLVNRSLNISQSSLSIKTAGFFLLFLALAWFSCRWSLMNFKWQFLYQILHPKVVEDKVLWLMPLIGVRYAMLTAALKMLVFRKHDDGKASMLIAKGFVALLLALLMLALGSGFHYPEFQSYRNVLLILGAFLCLGLGLIAGPIHRESQA